MKLKKENQTDITLKLSIYNFIVNGRK
jgi:hypothetical protein